MLEHDLPADLIYGSLPEDLGFVDLSPTEMMCWLYCPIHTPSEGWRIPANLDQFRPIIDRVLAFHPIVADRYVYITAKTLWVHPANPGNRPGWHTDGFGTDDINYIWYDRAPTQFILTSLEVPDDCASALALFEDHARTRSHIVYPAKRLLRLDSTVIHRSPVDFEPGMRTFVKLSVSRDRYNLEGNSINHLFREGWDLHPRFPERNHPCRDYA